MAMDIKERAQDFMRWRSRRRRKHGQLRSWSSGQRSNAGHTIGVDTLMTNEFRLRGALKDFAWQEDA